MFVPACEGVIVDRAGAAMHTFAVSFRMRTMNTMLLISFFGLFGCHRGVQTAQPPASGAPSFHTLSAVDIHGKSFDMAQLKGKKVLVVNVASECGNTPQYAQLEEMYKAYHEKGLVIIGFPCNQFGAQEPGNEAQIEQFCQKNYGVTFPLMSKIDVKGPAQSPVYTWLTQKKLNGSLDSEVKWNFQKYLIDEEGHLVMMVEAGTSPLDDRVMNWLDGK